MYTAIITSNCNLDTAQRQTHDLYTKLFHWCVANKIGDVHIAKFLPFVNEFTPCGIPDMCVSYYEIQEKDLTHGIESV